jgi:hypothetical protein
MRLLWRLPSVTGSAAAVRPVSLALESVDEDDYGVPLR